MPRRWVVSLVSGTINRTPMNTARAMGTLMRKAQCHEALVVSHPPTSGPMAAIPPIVAPHKRMRSPGLSAVHRVEHRQRRRQDHRGADTLQTRAPISALEDSELATSTLATANSVTPPRNMNRRPTMSDSRPTTEGREDQRVDRVDPFGVCGGQVEVPTMVGIAFIDDRGVENDHGDP